MSERTPQQSKRDKVVASKIAERAQIGRQISAEVEEIAKKYKVTVVALLKHAKMHSSSLQRWKSGESSPTLLTYMRLKRSFQWFETMAKAPDLPL